MALRSKPISVRRIRWIHQRLGKAYGEPAVHTRRTGLDQLICTLLSQNTNDTNSLEAFRRLKKRFPRWTQVADAAEADIAATIRIAGLSNQKAKRMKEILARVKADYGDRYTLAPLAKKTPDEAREYLLALPGIGAKTAACTLLFSFGMPVFPVDTHIHRVSIRLGLLGEKVTADQAHDLLGEAVPPELYHDFHLLLIQHGRRTCHARKPECGPCVLKAKCPSRQDRGSATATG